MRILAYSLYPRQTAPASRFRMEQFFPALQRAGIEIEYRSFFTAEAYARARTAGRARLAADAALAFVRAAWRAARSGSYDAVWLLREAAPIGPPVIEPLLGRFGAKPIVFDFDDAIWMAQNPEGALTGFLRWRGKTARNIARARTVVAGNAFLADYARRFNDEVAVVPTCVDLDQRYATAKAHGPGVPVVGWTGSHSTIGYLREIAGVLSEIGDAHEFRIEVISDRAPDFPFPEHAFHPWTADDEIERLLAFDVGLMPLRPGPWEEGKCGFKIVQYMALGIPPVVSDVGVNAEIVRHGVDGFVCRAPEDWREALATLIGDPELRSRMGASGRERIRAHYSVASQVGRLAEIFRAAVARA